MDLKYFKDNAIKILLLTTFINNWSLGAIQPNVKAQINQNFLSLEREFIAQNSLSLEQAIAKEINHARTDPQDYADWLEDLKQYYDGVWLKLPGEQPIRTNKGLKALEDAIAYLEQLKPLPALDLSIQLTSIAHEQLPQIKASDALEAGNLSYGRATAEGIVMQLVIGDGFISNKSANLFNPNWRETGVACQNDSRSENICLINYGESVAQANINNTSENNIVNSDSLQTKKPASEILTPPDESSLLLEKIERGILEQGDRVIPNDGSLYDSYPLEGKAGDSFIISVESEEFDTFLAVMDAKGTILEQNDDASDRNSNSRLKVRLPKTGTYNVIVNAYDKGGRGKYVLTVRR